MSVLTGLVSFGGGKSDGGSSTSTKGDGNESGSSNHNDFDGDDNCIANGSEGSCNEKNTYVGANPWLKVVPGLEAGTWRLLIRNLQPYTMVELELTGPNGEAFPLADYASREVRGDGSADTRQRHYFWCHTPDEPTGWYVLSMTGDRSDGNEVTRTARFMVGTAIAPSGCAA